MDLFLLSHTHFKPHLWDDSSLFGFPAQTWPRSSGTALRAVTDYVTDL